MSARLREGTLTIKPEPVHLPQAAEVRAVLDQVRPGLLADGGNVELVAVDPDGTVRLTLQGECSRCPSAVMTLRRVIEPALRAHFLGIKAVVLD